MARILFVTGTDTDVGKTVVAGMVTRVLRDQGARVAVAKPMASGNRRDARLLRRCVGGAQTLDEINPWHYREPLAPALAASRAGTRVALRDVLQHLRKICSQSRCDVLVVEGAGGLMSPLGMDFDSRDLLCALGATPIVVAPNRLGSIHQVLMVSVGFAMAEWMRARYFLMARPRETEVARLNLCYLQERLGRNAVVSFPWLGVRVRELDQMEIPPEVRQSVHLALTPEKV